MKIRIILADDHKIMRDGLRVLIEREPGMELLAEAENGREILEKVYELKPDVVIMDISMPDLNGIDATRQIMSRTPGVKVVALSIHSDRRFVAGMLNAGASGYLLKDCAFEELVKAIREVTLGKVYLSPAIANIVVKDYRRQLRKTGSSVGFLLTNREREILQLIAEGGNTKQIAFQLNVSIKTIETHRQQIMVKLNIHSVAELTKYAIREGLTSVEK